jgi:hypothetical protein
VCRGWRRVCDTCSALWERVSDEEVDTSSPEKVASFLWWCACRAGAIRCLRLQLKDFNQALPYPHDDDAHKKMRKVSSSLGFMLGVCGGSLEELVLGNPWACDDFVGVLPDHPYWVTPLKRLRTLEIGRSEEASYAPALLHALRTHCPELRNLALAPRRGDDVAAVLPPLGLERLEFNGYNLLSPTLTQLTRLTHLCWGVYDPIEDWRVVAALTSLQTMTVGASYEEEGRLPENISTLRNLRELSLELDPQYDDFFWWEGLEVGRHALRGVCAFRYLPHMLSHTASSPLPSTPAAPGSPSQPDQALILRPFPRRLPPAPGGPHNPALPRPVGGGASR